MLDIFIRKFFFPFASLHTYTS